MNVVKKAFIKSIPVMAGYICLGIGFGIMLNQIGYGPIWTFFMSLTIYAGTLQYVGVSLIASSATIINTIITSILIQVRHIFYGISMLNYYNGAGIKKIYLAFSLTDETYALLCDGEYPDGEDKYTYRFLVSIFNHSYWVIGGLLGNILAQNVNFDFKGIEFSMTAIFAASFADQWRTRKNHFPAILGVIVTTICLLIFGKDIFLIPSMLIITILLMIFRTKMEKLGI